MKMLDLKIEVESIPSPLAMRECKCGCGNLFQPGRKDQVYLNKKHADFAYNNGVRLEKDRVKNYFNKLENKNDRILNKYYMAMKKEVVVLPLEILRAEGFNPNLAHGTTTINGETFSFSHNYLFRYYVQEKEDLIKILRR